MPLQKKERGEMELKVYWNCLDKELLLVMNYEEGSKGEKGDKGQ